MTEVPKNRSDDDSRTRDSKELTLQVELGRAILSADQASSMDVGSVVELDSPIERGVELHVDGRLVARGEAVVVDDELAVRVQEIIRQARQAARKAGWTGAIEDG